ncbi:hypothetical protein HYV10_03340 [Candidatus Dependentiae bacterium]|nr:hypothetical protein [Candidatus Dependentiae bacterium]
MNRYNYFQILLVILYMMIWQGCNGIRRSTRLRLGFPVYSNSNPSDPSEPLNISSAGNGNLAQMIADFLQNGGQTVEVRVRFPVGTVFDIVNGDLGTTGTFTTTSELDTQISMNFVTENAIIQGQITTIIPVSGIYKYLDTNYEGGSLSGINLTGINAQGTLDINISEFLVSGSPTGIVVDNINISISALNNVSGVYSIIGGPFDGEKFTGNSLMSDVTISQGTLSIDGTKYTQANISIPNIFCQEGNISTGAVSIRPLQGAILLTNGYAEGATTGGINEIIFNGSGTFTGEYNDGAPDSTMTGADSCT